MARTIPRQRRGFRGRRWRGTGAVACDASPSSGSQYQEVWTVGNVRKTVYDQGRVFVYVVIVNGFEDPGIGWRCAETVDTKAEAVALLATYGARSYAAHYEKVRCW